MTSPRDPVVLIGPMGAGKTSIGRRVAKRLGVGFYDSDQAVVQEHGPIEELFANRGEPYFRALERAAVRAGLETGGVVALGGGAVMDAGTRADLARHRVVLLTVSPAVVAARLRDTTRPLLQTEDAMRSWRQIMERRRPLYEEVADITFDTSSGPLSTVVDGIVRWARSTAAGREQET